MTKYIVLLRGINVSGQKRIPMADLRGLLAKSGLEKVQTYIQSGNVIFESPEIEKKNLETLIHEAILTYFGFDVPVLVLKPEELKRIFDNCPFTQEKKEHSYFTMLFSSPEKELVREASKMTYPHEEFVITNDCIYFYCSIGYGKAKYNNNFFERKLKVTATARNYKTVVKLLSLSAE